MLTLLHSYPNRHLDSLSVHYYISVGIVVALLSTSRWISRTAPVYPGHPSNHTLVADILWKVYLKHFSIPISLLSLWRVNWPTGKSAIELLISHLVFSLCFQTVNP